MKKTIALILTALMIVPMLTACGGNPAQSNTPAVPESTSAPEAPAYAIDELVIGTTYVIENAVRGEYNYDMLASAVTELPLVYQDTNGDYHALLADFATEDATTWTYTVMPGMTWDDGETVTAEDILFTLQYEDSTGSANLTAQTDSDGKTTQAKYTDYELSDDNMSISLMLAAANVRELSNMTSFRVMPKHIYEGKDTVTDDEARIGCGAYKFESFSKEAGTLGFIANPAYPEKPNVERIVYQMFGSEDTMYMALKNGDIDMVWNYSSGVPASYAEILDGTVMLESVPAVNAPAVLAFNNANGFFSDENMRLAVSYALDYDMFREYFGSAWSVNPNRGFVPGTTLGYVDTESLANDAAKAGEYMTAAGYAKNSGGFFEKDGTEAVFTLTYNAEKENHAGCAELIKTQLEAFGIRVELDGVDKDSYNAKTSNKFSENNITMEAAIYGFTSAGMGMMNGLGTIYVDGTHPVQGGCQVFDAEFAAARDKMAEAGNVEEYCEGAADMQEFYAAHIPLIALYWDNLIYAYAPEFENVTVDCVFGLNNVNNWFTISRK